MKKKHYLNPLSNLVKSQIQVVLFLPQCHAISSTGNTPLPLESTHSLGCIIPTRNSPSVKPSWSFPGRSIFCVHSHSDRSCVNDYIYDLIYNEFIICASAPLLVHCTFFILENASYDTWLLVGAQGMMNKLKLKTHIKSFHASRCDGDILWHSFWESVIQLKREKKGRLATDSNKSLDSGTSNKNI